VAEARQARVVQVVAVARRAVREVEVVVAASAVREEKEARSRQRYRNGELGLDVQGMREPLARKGLRYVDHPDGNAALAAPAVGETAR